VKPPTAAVSSELTSVRAVLRQQEWTPPQRGTLDVNSNVNISLPYAITRMRSMGRAAR